MTDYEIIIKVDGEELHHSVLNDVTYQSISEDLEEYFEKIKDKEKPWGQYLVLFQCVLYYL